MESYICLYIPARILGLNNSRKSIRQGPSQRVVRGRSSAGANLNMLRPQDFQIRIRDLIDLELFSLSQLSKLRNFERSLIYTSMQNLHQGV